MKTGELLGKLAKKAGIDTTTDEWKPILALDHEVPAEIATKVDNGLLSVEAAKQHPDVKKAVKAEVLAGADAKIESVMTELGIAGDDDFKGEKNTFEKIARLTKLAQEAGKKASGSTNKQTAEEFAREKEDYNRQIRELKEKLTKQETDYNSQRENDLTDFEFQNTLFGKDYALPKEMDTKLKVSTARGAVQQALLQKGYKLKRNEAGQLTIVDKDGAPAYGADNVALEPNTFIDGVLTQNKLLRINDPNAAPGDGGSGGTGHVIPGGGAPKNGAMVAELGAQLKDLPA